MDDLRTSYRSPLETRYASSAMRELFSEQRKFTTWRRLWLALAEAQQQLGLAITDAQLAAMRAHLDDVDYAQADAYETKFRHDVMAHIHAFGEAAPEAKGIIHLGATSQFVNCNTDILVMRQALGLLLEQLANVIDALGRFAERWKNQPCLGFTHFQPAQMTTVGKRATLWCMDFIRDLRDLEYRRDGLEFRGVKGTTGTQASFLALFGGDHEKVKTLDKLVAEKMGFGEDKIACVTGQTYSRKIDAAVAQALAGIGVSVHKMCNDVRLLAHRKELEEPFAKDQVGSSAMAYKRNPMRCERATALARFLVDVSMSPVHTAAEQWLERTLDDSANKRLAMSEAFLSADACLRIVANVAEGLVVYPAVIEANIAAELPFMATENILMAAVQAGGDRQELHEAIRKHSIAAAREVKEKGRPNDLIARLKADKAFAKIDVDALLDPKAFVGRAPQQTEEFLQDQVVPIRQAYAAVLKPTGDLKI
ncbi:MAG: adenylosuccinate lyase [Phycisphaerae bacterium]|nr:adenylosuccinate lyase [Phycisphaerae bacterium]